MKKLLTKLGWWLIKSNCQHQEKKITFEYYPYRCIYYWCEDCKSEIVESMDV